MFEHFGQERGGAADGVDGDLFWGAGGGELAAFGSGFGADIEDVVGFGDDVEVVLNDDDGVAIVHEAVEDVDQFGDIGGVEADGGFLDEVEVAFGVPVFADAFVGSAGDAAAEFGDEFETLGFAA